MNENIPNLKCNLEQKEICYSPENNPTKWLETAVHSLLKKQLMATQQVICVRNPV